MAKRKVPKRRKSQKGNRKQKSKKIAVKQKFVQAMSRLRRMKKNQQKAVVSKASNEFIRDVSGFMKKIRNKPNLVKKTAHRKTLKRYSKHLRKLIHAKTPIHKKRLILQQRGGIFPFLIPIIIAGISAAGSIGAAATSAAILKS